MLKWISNKGQFHKSWALSTNLFFMWSTLVRRYLSDHLLWSIFSVIITHTTQYKSCWTFCGGSYSCNSLWTLPLLGYGHSSCLRIHPTFEKLFTGIKIQRKAQNIRLGCKRCCIFRPAFGCCALQTLVEIVFFNTTKRVYKIDPGAPYTQLLRSFLQA